MRYERHIPQFDNIVEIETIDPAEYRETRWQRRSDEMERDALGDIESMVMTAKRKLRLIPDEILDLAESREARFRRALGSMHAQTAGQSFWGHPQDFMNVAQQQRIGYSGGLFGGIFG